MTAVDSAQFKRFIAGLDTFSTTDNEFQRTDVAPEGTFGDGRLDAADQQQMDNYIAVLDPPRTGGGPTAPIQGRDGDDSVYARSEGQGRIYRIVPTTGSRGDEVIVTIELDTKGNETGMSFTIGFDPSKLSFSAISGTNNNADVTDGSGSRAGMNRTLNAAEADSGRLGLLLDSPSPLEARNIQIVNLRFRILAGAESGATPLTFADDSIPRSTTNANAESLDAAYQNGEVTIKTGSTGGSPVRRPRWLHSVDSRETYAAEAVWKAIFSF